MAVPGQSLARSQPDRPRHRRAAACAITTTSRCALLVNRLRQARAAVADIKQEATRTPYFCSGCPHNRSTVIPEGARAYAGIGCHFMAQFMDRRTDGYTQMGGEGANWVGEARFSKRGHVFQNLGDGTYNHSGALGPALGDRYQDQRHLQDPVQRRRRHDRRPAPRGRPHRAADRQAGRRRRRPARGRRDRPARQICARRALAGGLEDLPARGADRSRGGAVEDPRDDGPHLRPDLRGREAAPAQARRVPRSRQARLHQRTRLRGLRRLRRQVELRVDSTKGDRIRPQARHRPIKLQQGFLLHRRLLPVLRDGGGRAGAQVPQGRRRAAAHGGARAAGADRYALFHRRHRRRRHRRRDDRARSSAWPRISKAAAAA